MKLNLKSIILYSTALLLINVCFGKIVPEDKKELLFLISDLSEFNIKYVQNDSTENFEYKHYGYDAWKIEYSYNNNGIENTTPLLIISKVDCYSNLPQAILEFKGQVATYKTAANIGGLSIKEMPNLFNEGDDNFCTISLKDNRPAGNYIKFRRGCIIYSLTIAGTYLDNPITVSKLLIPKIEKIASYKKE